MPTVVNLPPDLEGRVIAEAARVGVTPERLVIDLLDGELAANRQAVAIAVAAEAMRVAAARRSAAVALLDLWLAEADSEEQRETFETLARGIDANRPGQRPHFPPEAKGRTW